jgi:hypothetical protein
MRWLADLQELKWLAGRLNGHISLADGLIRLPILLLHAAYSKERKE